MNSCKYWDCGWCYAPDDVKTNARIVSKVCYDPNNCPYLKSQMTKEIDISTVLIEGEYATIMGVKYKRIEEPKSPAEEAFKRVYTYYPVTDITDPCWDGSTWTHFANGYKSAQEDYKVGEYEPTEQKWDVVRESVKWCEEHREESVEDYLKPQTEKVSNEVKKLQEKNWYVDAKDLIESETSLPEPTSTVFRQKLFDGIKSVFYDPDYERTHWKLKVDMVVDEVLTHFYDVIPKSQEPVYGDFDEGWDSCLKCIEMRMEFSDD